MRLIEEIVVGLMDLSKSPPILGLLLGLMLDKGMRVWMSKLRVPAFWKGKV